MSTKRKSDLPSPERLEKIAADAGERTSIRIVPVVVKASGQYDRAEELIGLWAAAVALALIWLFFRHADIGRHLPSLERVWYGGVLPVLMTLAAGFGIGALLTTQMVYVRRWFVPRRQISRNVQARAEQALEEARTRYHTDHPAEILVLFISLFERSALIRPGEAVSAKLSPDDLASVQHTLQEGIKSYQVEPAMAQAVRQAAALLAPHFPPRTDKTIAREPETVASLG